MQCRCSAAIYVNFSHHLCSHRPLRNSLHRVSLAVLCGGQELLPLKVAPIQPSVTAAFNLKSRRDSNCQMWEFILNDLCPFSLWPFQLVADSVCDRFGLWPFRFVALSACGRSGSWPFRFMAFSVCGRFGLWPFRFWPFGLWSLWPETIVFAVININAQKLNEMKKSLSNTLSLQNIDTTLFWHYSYSTDYFVECYKPRIVV